MSSLSVYRWRQILYVALGGKTRIVIMELAKARQTIEKPASETSEHEAWAAFFRPLPILYIYLLQ